MSPIKTHRSLQEIGFYYAPVPFGTGFFIRALEFKPFRLSSYLKDVSLFTLSTGGRADMTNVILCVDFWNFQLGWNNYMKAFGGSPGSPVKISWKQLPQVLIAELPAVIGTQQNLVYRGTKIYASVSPATGGKDEPLKNFLHNVLGQMTGFDVLVKDRKWKTDQCPHCKKTIERTIEKGVDSSIISSLFEGAINDSFDVAILLSNDSDLVPAIKIIQDRLNKQIVHAGFRAGGHHARSAAWTNIILDGDIAEKLREGNSSK